MLFIYQDESGCMGFSKKGASKFLTICLLIVDGEQNRRKINIAVKKTIKNKFKSKSKKDRKTNELKGTKDSFAVKKYFYDILKRSKTDFKIYSLTLNKGRVQEDLKRNTSRLYNYITNRLLQKVDIITSKTEITFIIDKSKSKSEIKDFNGYIRRELEKKIEPNVRLDILHQDSTSDHCLNAVDYFSWGIFRKFEHKDTEWYEVFLENIKRDEVFLK